MNPEILTEEVQQFLRKHENANPGNIALAKSPFPSVSSPELALQIEARQKARHKLPDWHASAGIYYPVGLSVEQASSEITAAYKKELVREGERIIDLTGGFGVDSHYFAQKVSQVTHCELNPELSAIARHNAEQFGQKNITFINSDGIQYMLAQPASTFSTAYIDPSRRVKTQKVFKLDDCEPDIVAVQDKLLAGCSRVLVKTSPLLDISLSLSQLKQVREVHILSIKNECKELLFVLEAGFEGICTIHVALLNAEEKRISFFRDEELHADLILGEPSTYLYDPDAALLKAGCFKWISTQFGLDKLSKNTHLYTSPREDLSFPGRVFHIQQVMPYKDFKKVKKTYAANVIAKNFPLKVADIRKKHNIGESKSSFMFFCRTMDEQMKVIFAERINPN